VKRSYSRFIVFSQPRTGSTLLISSLKHNQQVIAFGEVFNPNPKAFFRDNASTRSLAQLLFKVFPYFLLHLRNLFPTLFLDILVFRKYSKTTKAVGFKLFAEHLKGKRQNQILQYLYKKSFKIILLERENLLEQVVSLKIAKKTGAYHASNKDHKNDLTLRLEPAECEGLINQLQDEKSKFQEEFRTLECLNITYENLISDYGQQTINIQEFLGVGHQRLPISTHRQEKRQLPEIIENFEELKRYFSGTNFEKFFR
jgi:LPS sulfotransferase NodH